MIVARVAKGVTAHFVSRMQEWAYAAMLIGMGYELLRPEETFNLPVYRVMATVGNETQWGSALISVGGVRLVALVVNGTFPQFHTITPIVRSVMAMLSAFVWFCLAWGFYAASPHGITWVGWAGLTASDIGLSWIVAREAGAAEQRYRNACRERGRFK